MAYAGIDWLSQMRQHAQTSPEIFDGRLDTDWITRECETAREIVFAECPDAEYRYQQGDLSETLLAYVVCQMVLRVARWTMYRTESNGQYQYTTDSPIRTPSGMDMSANLWVTDRERALLEGNSNGRGPMGTVWMTHPFMES